MFRVSVLGGQQITNDRDGEMPVRSSRALALVAFLAVHAGVPHARQRIAGLLWPESGDAQALTNLRRELHHLRQALDGDDSLRVTPRQLCWTDAPTCHVDVRAFGTERMAALAAAESGDDEAVIARGGNAISHYRGDLLPGVYDDWAAEARARLERQCVELCDLVGAARARTGDLAGAVVAARRRIELTPLEETGYRVLMELQADMGDRAAAVSTYQHCRSLLERELGVVPDDATRAVYQRITAHERERALGRVRPGRPDAPLIGRSGELSALRDAWRAAAGGRRGVVLVAGAAGVGKTRLVTELADLAGRQGAVVVSTHCFAVPGRLALAPVADWLRDPAVRAAAATLDPAWRAEVERLTPDRSLAGIDPGSGTPGSGTRESPTPESPTPEPGRMADAWQRHRFFEGLARAFLAVGRPLLLVLDNVQWCDEETLDFITFCLGLADHGTQLLVAGTMRDNPRGDHDHGDHSHGDHSHGDDQRGDDRRGDDRRGDDRRGDRELAAWTLRMRAAGMLTELPLSPLDAADTARLARAISGRNLAAADQATLYAATGGFPLYVIEAARGNTSEQSERSGPVGHGTPRPSGDLSAVLRTRLNQTTPAAQEIAGLAAAVGADFSLDLLTEASDLAPDIVVAAVDELWRNRILREFGAGYDFSHDLLREAAYATVTPARRWLLHRRIASGVELLHAGDTDVVAAQLAVRYARVGGQAKAVAYYRRAAQVAAGRFAYAEAIRLYREALAVIKGMPAGLERDDTELSVLTALAAPLNAREGYASTALEHGLERSIALAESLGRDDITQAGLVALSSVWFVQGRTADSHQIARRAFAMASPGSGAAAEAGLILGGTALHLGRPAEGLRHLTVTAELGSGLELLSTGTRAKVHVPAWAAHAHWLLGDDELAVRAAEDAVAMARAVEHPYNLAVALAYSAVTHQLRHDLPRLRETVARLRELCERYDFGYYREWGMILGGWSAAAGQEGPGIALAELGIRQLKAQGAFARQPYWLSLLADVQARAGRPYAARAILDAALAAGRAHDDLWWLPEVMRMRAGYDPPARAAARLRAAANLASSHGSVALARRCADELRRHGR